jgi:hypothetical protein
MRSARSRTPSHARQTLTAQEGTSPVTRSAGQGRVKVSADGRGVVSALMTRICRSWASRMTWFRA